MSETSTILDLKYKENNFQNTKSNYEWVMNSVGKLEFECKLGSFSYMFKYGEYSNYGNSYEEFIAEALDKNDFKLICMNFHYDNIYISIEDSYIYMRSSNKVLIHNLVTILKDEEKELKQVTNVYHAPVINGGNNNNIVTDNAQLIQNNKNGNSFNATDSKISGGVLNDEIEKKSMLNTLIDILKGIFS